MHAHAPIYKQPKYDKIRMFDTQKARQKRGHISPDTYNTPHQTKPQTDHKPPPKTSATATNNAAAHTK
jgi:hypothetical protein